MFDEILGKTYPRKVFFLTVTLIISVLVIIRYLVLPSIDDSLGVGWVSFFANMSDGIIVSMLVTIFIGAFLYFLTPENVKNSTIEITEPRNLPELFENAFSNTELWWYKGGCGRYFRTKVLPEMAVWARKTSLSREIRVVVLDPLNSELCEAHAIFRKSTASAELESSAWNIDKVRNELYATIVTVLVFQLEEPRLRISLSLASHYSAFRIDLSSSSAIITKEDRKAPAIICKPESYYYKSYKDEIILSESQSKHVPPLSSGDYTLTSLTKESVKKILEESNLTYENMSNESFNEVATICKGRKNPYG